MISNAIKDKSNGSVLISHDLNGIVAFIKSNHCKKITVLTGAGISVSAGIPDYRSKDGFYNTVNLDDFPTLTVDEKKWVSEDIETRLLSIELFKFNPAVLWQIDSPYIIDLMNKKSQKYLPTLSHWFIKLLDNKKYLKRCYTTNIDGLQVKTGLNTINDKILHIHGTFTTIECYACQRQLDDDEMIQFLNKLKNKMYLKEILKCKYCIGNNIGPPFMKPSIIMFGESVSFKYFDIIHNKKDLNDIDLLIIIGTTLKVSPANLLPVVCRNNNKKCVRLLINKGTVKEFDEMFDFNDPNSNDVFLNGESDDIIMKLAKLLGWDNDLLSLSMQNDMNQLANVDDQKNQ